MSTREDRPEKQCAVSGIGQSDIGRRLGRDPLELTRMKHADFVRLGGAESVEVIMWVAMRGALSDGIRKIHQNYYLATTTAMTVALYEEPAASALGLSRAAA